MHQIFRRRLNDGDMPELIDFLTGDKRVNRLNLAYNDFGDEGASLLSNLLTVIRDTR